MKLSKTKKKYKAILSLETTYISLPSAFVYKLIENMNKSELFNCIIDKSNNGAI
jgi:hypothetical protein